MMGALKNLLSFLVRYERQLGAVFFVFGFLTDAFTFTQLPLTLVNAFFAGYLALAALSTFGTSVIAHFSARDAWWRRTLAALMPLAAQYALGGLLSGFLVFYASRSALSASWPFIILLFLVYLGSEYWRKEREHLIFQTVLFYFSLYAYAIFALPFYIGKLGPLVFLASTALAAGLFAVFLLALRFANKARARQNARAIISAAAAVTAVIVAAYFSGAIPPVPLALSDAGIYHRITKIPGGYEVLAEAPRPWYDLRTPVIHASSDEMLIAYSAVAAPADFGGAVVHRLEHKGAKGWTTESLVAFPITGGRAGGYRGYSELQHPAAGEWRLSVETPSGQVIGRYSFDVENAGEAPALSPLTK